MADPVYHPPKKSDLLLDELANCLVRAERTLGIEFRAPRRGLLDDLDRLNPGTGEREELLNPDAIALAGDGEGTRDVLATVVDSKDLALEILHAELLAFLNLDRNTNDIAGMELGEVLLREIRGLLGVDLINKLNTHDSPP